MEKMMFWQTVLTKAREEHEGFDRAALRAREPGIFSAMAQSKNRVRRFEAEEINRKARKTFFWIGRCGPYELFVFYVVNSVRLTF